MKAKFIYEAFEKKDKKTAREDLLFPNKVIVEESLSDIIEMITETLSNEISPGDFSSSGNEETFNISEEITDRYSEYEGICWKGDNGAITNPMLYTSIKAIVDVGVEIEPYEPQTREDPGSPGFWGMYGNLKELKVFYKEEQILNVSKTENEDIYKSINNSIEKTCENIEQPDWDPY